MKKIPANLRILVFYALCFLSLLTIFRFALLAIYFPKAGDSPWSEVALSFLIGIRFDLSVIAIVLGPSWFLSSLHFANRWKTFRYTWGILPILLFLWMTGHLIGDTIYYGEADKHLGYEGFVFLGKDLLILIEAGIKNDTLKVVLGLFGIMVGLPSLIYLFIKYNGYEFSPDKKKSELLQIPISILVALLLFRGGFQSRPLRSTEAIHSENGFLNNLPLNGVFTTIMDLKSKSILPELQMQRDEAIRIVRKEIEYPGAKFVSEEFPILRETEETRKGTPPNIVIVLLESWAGKFLKPNGDGIVGGKELAPNFNALVPQGRYYPRFFATGGRTVNGLLSVLTGIPDRPGITVVRTHQALGSFGGLGSILKSQGYSTYFVHGGDVGFDNMSFLFPHWGFDTIVGKTEMEKEGKYKSGAWGFYDGDVLEELNTTLESAKQPFAAVTLTLTTHYPYQVPEGMRDPFPESLKDSDYFNTYKYSDDSLGRFLEKAKKSKYFENTVFVFVADHTHHRDLNPFEDRNIPFLLYSPKYVRPGTDPRISSQLDIIPTILGLVGKKVRFSSFGKDLLSTPTTNSSAYFAFSSVIGWIENDYALYRSTEGELREAYPMPWNRAGEKCASLQKTCDLYEYKARAFLNLSYDLLNSNRIFPDK
ncbi:alkaline phosphatase family protein [Leptospira wolffii]|uniref:LTA synthase family protein n=1 Tax=Leptospira wolffii TaxID=409998 RepID=UPI001082543A|nr:alkaline phosphatase family protein [Leptospira wolffii]TGK60098.1 alkaline phosphatase family protein [Leptospira wolffii]TGK72441.1 alkaline phosphatase family protein [Leptospira wolffii]TGK76105.1 alkaline phosphatase family protein [Leptospira wolffii]TGL30357.1 alkaline phosphatase family protein [Leptospira wolffii]